MYINYVSQYNIMSKVIVMIPGHVSGSIQFPLRATSPSGQKQPSAHPLGQIVASVLSQV